MHWLKCVEAVSSYADALIGSIKAERMNASSFEGLIRSYLEAPAFYPEWREPLLNLAQDQLNAALS